MKPAIYFFRARFYHAELGRFISRDPLGYEDGMSLYKAYFVPNGLDPFGTFSCDAKAHFGNVVSSRFFSFYLEMKGESSDCCNIDNYESKTNLFNPVFGVVSPPQPFATRCPYGIAWAKLVAVERKRLPPIDDEMCSACPCPKGIECVTVIYDYGCVFVFRIGDAQIRATFCADGSFSSKGTGNLYGLGPHVGPDFVHSELVGKEHIYETDTCEPYSFH